jgi:hypothetical protein
MEWSLRYKGMRVSVLLSQTAISSSRLIVVEIEGTFF